MNIIELIKLIPVDMTFVYSFVCVISVTHIFYIAANHAYKKEKTKTSIENHRFTKSLQQIAPWFLIFAYFLFKATL
jgi:hypothetical protein